MTRTMYDGVNSLAAGIARQFPDAAMVAGYVDGDYAWTDEWALFPHAEHVTITVKGGNADVADVENGDMTPGQVWGWIAERRVSGLYRPTVYCSLSKVPAIRQATRSYVLGRDYDIWVADYTGQPHEVPGCAATQYESTAGWDASAVYDGGWPHRTPPAPQTTTEVDVKLPELRQGDSGQGVLNWQGLLVAHAYGYMIANAAGRNVMERAGVDGVFGPATAEATKRFQEGRKMAVTGTVGAAEWTAALG